MSGKVIRLEAAQRWARLIICGGRFYGCMLDSYASDWARRQDEKRIARQRAKLFKVLDLLRPREIAHGGAQGADTLAGEWAESRCIVCEEFSKGPWSGYDRNQRMFEDFNPDGTVAFPGGNGTADMERVTLKGGAWLVRIWRRREL